VWCCEFFVIGWGLGFWYTLCMEKSARGVRGFLLYSPVTRGYFFRVYDLVDKAKFLDYCLAAEDIEVEILSDVVFTEGRRLDYSRRVLGKESDETIVD